MYIALQIVDRCETAAVSAVSASLDALVATGLILAALLAIVSAAVFLAVQVQSLCKHSTVL